MALDPSVILLVRGGRLPRGGQGSTAGQLEELARDPFLFLHFAQYPLLSLKSVFTATAVLAAISNPKLSLAVLVKINRNGLLYFAVPANTEKV
jgi:hypothetical protein